MHITVAICTWNRSALLDQTLTQMRALHVPPGKDWELLVVDNNCTDDTAQVVARHAEKLPIRALFEPKPGQSNARNCAMAAARGKLLIWTDDDVLVDTGWLAAYAQAMENWPDAVFFGGTVEPWFAVEPPAWVRRHLPDLTGVYAIAQYGNEVGPLGPDQSLVGANLAMRPACIRGYQFNPNLGRRHGELSHGDDTDFVDQARRAGHLGLWVGDARVRHYIPSERLTVRYVRDWFVGHGRSFARMHNIHDDCTTLWGQPRWLLRSYWQARLQSWLYRPFRGERWFHHFREAAKLQGFIEEWHAGRQRAGSAEPNGQTKTADTPPSRAGAMSS